MEVPAKSHFYPLEIPAKSHFYLLEIPAEPFSSTLPINGCVSCWIAFTHSQIFNWDFFLAQKGNFENLFLFCKCQDVSRIFFIILFTFNFSIFWYRYSKGKFHCTADLLFYCFGFSGFENVELETDLRLWSNPNQSNRRSAIQ